MTYKQKTDKFNELSITSSKAILGLRTYLN